MKNKTKNRKKKEKTEKLMKTRPETQNHPEHVVCENQTGTF
jgi:hypothetical protein